MLIGNMELADSVGSNGFIIYTPDGYKAKKMTVDRLAKAIEAYMRNDSNAGEGHGGGLQFWKEFKDYRQNSYLYTENPAEEFISITQLHLGSDIYNRDCWTSEYQYDTYETPTVPYFPGIIEFKELLQDGTVAYYPYSVYSLIHVNGSVLQDFENVQDTLYKIPTSEYGKLSIYIFLLGDAPASGTVILPGELQGITDVTNTFPLPEDAPDNVFRIYKLDGVYSSYDECANALSDFFLLTSHTVEIAGYFNYGNYISNLANYITEGPDEGYTYINSAESMVQVQRYSEDNLTYIDKEDLKSLLLDILAIELKPTYTAISNVGIYFEFPFYRGENSDTKKELAVEAARAMYTEDKIMLRDADFEDVIFLGNDEEYSKFVKKYISDQLENIDFVSEVYLGDFSVVDNSAARIYASHGLKVVKNGNNPPELVVDNGALQPALTPGEGVSINNNVISATGSIEEIYVDGVSAIDPETKVAEIWLPTGLKETRLNNGDHIEIEKVSQGTNYDIYKINAVDIKNNVIANSDSHSFLNNADAESAVIASITVPADAKGIIVANLYFDSGTNTNDGIVSALVSDNGSWPANDQTLYTTPMYDSKPINKPYQIAGVDHNALTNLKIFGRYANTFSSPLTVYLLAKKDVNSTVDVQGEITFTQDIDI